MKIAIAMATWNGEAYIKQQLDSFVLQNRMPDELVVSDDGSTDATVQILESFSRSSPFPVSICVNSERLGCSANFSQVLSFTDADAVLMSDQDDVWLPTKVGTIESTFQQRPDVGVVINDAYIADAELSNAGLTRIVQMRMGGYSIGRFHQGACTSIRGDLLKHLLPIPSDVWMHDSWIHTVGALVGARYVLPAPLQYFRRHGANESDSPTSSLRELRRSRVLIGRLRRNLASVGKRRESLEGDVGRLETLWLWWSQNGAWNGACASRAAPGGTYSGRESGDALEGKLRVARERVRVVQRRRGGRLLPLSRLYVREGSSRYGAMTEFIKDVVVK